MSGATRGSMRWHKRIVRWREDLCSQDGTFALELTCGHVVQRERRGGLFVYCEKCRERILAEEEKP